MICCPVTTVRLTAAGVPRIIVTERTYRLACRSMVALLVLSQRVLFSDAAALPETVVKILFLSLLPPSPHPNPLISCICGGCVFCELVSSCGCGVRCRTFEPHETQLTLLILPLFFFFLRKFEFRISVICKRSKFVHCNIIKRTHSWRGACWSTEGLYLHEQSVSFLHR